jgi:enterochelin esterase-like enzyme
MSSDLLRWADDHLRTIATSAARATLGFSQGGYCAAALVANHPSIFSSAMSFSGYFVSGIHSGTTPDAWRPFNDDPAVEYRVSPMTVIPRVSAAGRSRLFFVMASDPKAGLYGPQIKQFAAVLHGAHVSMSIFPTPLGHSWEAARTLLPTMLRLVAGRMVTLGVFASPR